MYANLSQKGQAAATVLTPSSPWQTQVNDEPSYSRLIPLNPCSLARIECMYPQCRRFVACEPEGVENEQKGSPPINPRSLGEL